MEIDRECRSIVAPLRHQHQHVIHTPMNFLLREQDWTLHDKGQEGRQAAALVSGSAAGGRAAGSGRPALGDLQEEATEGVGPPATTAGIYREFVGYDCFSVSPFESMNLTRHS